MTTAAPVRTLRNCNRRDEENKDQQNPEVATHRGPKSPSDFLRSQYAMFCSIIELMGRCIFVASMLGSTHPAISAAIATIASLASLIREPTE
jgi:hypothetical protein